MAIWNTIQLSEIHPDRFDAEYFRKDYKYNIEFLGTTGETIALGKLFKYVNRGTQPLYNKKGTLKALRSVNVGFMSFNETRQEYVTEDFFAINTRGKVQKDDVLITSTGVGTLGRTSIWFKNERAFCDGHITILRNGKIDPYFITAFLNSKYGLRQYDQNYRGSSGQIEIYPYDISKFLIPECLFSHQTEIGNYLREAFELQTQSKVNFEEARTIVIQRLGISNFINENKKSRVTNLSELSSSLRIDAQCFKPEFLQYEEFIRSNNRYNRLSTLINSITKGNQQIISQEGVFPYVSIKDISGIDIVAKGKVISPISKAFHNDLLLAVTGATIGKIGIIHRYPALSFSGDILGLSINKDKISPWYLLAILSSPIGQTQFNRWITGSTNGHLSPSDVRKIIVPRLNEEDELKIEVLLKSSTQFQLDAEILLLKAKARVEQLIDEAANK